VKIKQIRKWMKEGNIEEEGDKLSDVLNSSYGENKLCLKGLNVRVKYLRSWF
jgi:hypothetical protein